MSLPGSASKPRPIRPIVVGIAGGIGSGKSTVARLLAARGAVISDSDDQAKALLLEPAIGHILARWWGKGVLGPDGLPDRAKVASIIFADPAQRQRLEGLIHPILKSQRASALRIAARAVPAVPMFVIDAPLLFEAGIDKECDATLYVDAPRAARLARLIKNRGWTEPDLTRREAAQLPLSTKQARSTFVIDNAPAGAADGAGDAASHLSLQIDGLWPRLLARRSLRA
ncbi:MAG: dephospho-CoA kinase [Phycisphaerales bacterium]|nr:dephospho-CoA kinase [Phycisphaerales bacterium]